MIAGATTWPIRCWNFQAWTMRRGARICPTSPVQGGSEDPEPISEFTVLVDKWSDGTDEPKD